MSTAAITVATYHRPRVPVLGKYESWTLYFNLHDRFPDLGFLRGPLERALTSDDGFDVAIAHFPARDDPTSAGAAVARIRLLEVPDGTDLAQPVRLPPEGLPRRHIFWREEMADGVIEGKVPTQPDSALGQPRTDSFSGGGDHEPGSSGQSGESR